MSAIPTPFFLDSPSGRRFAVHHAPDGNNKPWGNVLCVPAFNEEMNRCRSMLTLQAQAFAKQGVGTLIIDLHGTGESDGDHGEARWASWLKDIAIGMAWLADRPGACTALLGVRLGVPLAVQALSMSTPGASPALIAWQPVTDGKSYFTQFLRMRMAANMDRTDIPKDTTSGMRKDLAAGRSIEVAGYEIHPDLAAAIEEIKLSQTPPVAAPIAWFERTAGATGEAPPASLSAIEAWRSHGAQIDLQTFQGPAFWALHDRATAPALIAQTTEWVKTLRKTI